MENETRDNYLTDEELTKVLERVLVPYPEEVTLAKCSHRTNGQISQEVDGVFYCDKCGTSFMEYSGNNYVKVSVSQIIDVLESIKMMYELPEATTLRIAELIASIKKIPLLYEIVRGNSPSFNKTDLVQL